MASRIAVLSTLLATIVAAHNGEHLQHLRKLSNKDASDSDKSIVHWGNGAFVDGTETVYDDHSLAWRFLGFYTDCNTCLDGDGDDDGGGDEDDEFQDPSNCVLGNGEDTTVCRRYALWAAYVDEGYEGNGKNEYQYYDRQHHKWDDSECLQNNNDDSRCVKMDCHDPSSKNFKLIGVYKDHKTNDFLENLIDYSGDCVWNDDEYKFMQAMNNDNNNNNNDYWPPKKCTAYKNSNDGSVRGYYDAVPTAKGNLQMALFTDGSCTVPYESKSSDRDEIEAEMEELVGRAASDLESWNSAMDAFKICQPCLSYDTLFLDSGKNKNGYNANGDRYGGQQQNDDDENDNAEEDHFLCSYNLEQDEPINQCEVLVEGGKDTMTVATYQDILLAESQGTVTGIDLSPTNENKRGKLVMGEPFVKPKHSWLSLVLLLVSGVYFWHALSELFEKDKSKNKSKKTNKKSMKEPLVESSSQSSNNNKSGVLAVTGVTAAIAAVALSQKSTKDQRKAKKKEQQKQKQQNKSNKSILKKTKSYDDDNSEDGSNYRGL